MSLMSQLGSGDIKVQIWVTGDEGLTIEGGWGVNHSEGAKYVKWAKKPSIKKSDKKSKK